MASKRVESRKAVIKHFVRGEAAHTRRSGWDGDPQLASIIVASTGQVHLTALGVVVAIRTSYDQFMVYRDTSVVGELVPALRDQGYRKGLQSPSFDMWFKEED